ncbi:hypothetical protein [Bacillus sp. Marseille-P3800]|nr:hypothetical protein [Bacillus sp. Marseille-P3800]
MKASNEFLLALHEKLTWIKENCADQETVCHLSELTEKIMHTIMDRH